MDANSRRMQPKGRDYDILAGLNAVSRQVAPQDKIKYKFNISDFQHFVDTSGPEQWLEFLAVKYYYG